MSASDWWDLLKQLFGQSRNNLDGQGSFYDPDVRPPDLNRFYTVSGSYAGSGLKQTFNDAQFYYIDSNGQLELVQDTNRIRIVKRAYNDGSVGIIFEDMATNQICMPRGVEFDLNVVRNPKRAGEYLLRNGGSVNGSDPSNMMWNSTDISYQVSVLQNSIEAVPPPRPDPSAGTKQVKIQAPNLKITFKQMVGNASVIYNGEVTIKQVQKDGYWVLNFYDSDGNSLGLADQNTSRQIWTRLWDGGEGGYKIPDSYLLSGDNDALGWLNRAFYTDTPTPSPIQPPSINTQSITFDTAKLKYTLKGLDGSVYTQNEVRVLYYYNPDNGQYQITFQDPNGRHLSLDGQDLPPLVNGRYQMRWEQGKTFAQQFEEEFGKSDPTPTPPPAPTQNRFQTNTSQYSLMFESNGERYRGGIDIIYSFSAGQWNFRVVKAGTNDPLTLTGDNIQIAGRTDDGAFYQIEYEDGVSFADSFKGTYGGAPPDSPPTPPPLPSGYTRINANTSTSAWKFLRLTNRDGTPYTGQYYIDFQQDKFGSNLSAQVEDIQFYRLDESGNKIYIDVDFGQVSWGMGGFSSSPIWDSEGNIVGQQFSFTMPSDSGGTFQDFLTQYYDTDRGLYPHPQPRPPKPSGDRIIGTIEAEDYVGLIFSNSTSESYEGDVTAKWLGDTDGDGKNEVVFLDADGNQLQLEVAQGYEADVPELEDVPTTGGRRIGDRTTWTYQTDESFSVFSNEFLNGFDVTRHAPIIPIGNEGYTIEGFILYRDAEETFGVSEPSYEPDITKSVVLGFCNWQDNYEKDEKTRKVKLFGFGEEPEDPEDDMPLMPTEPEDEPAPEPEPEPEAEPELEDRRTRAEQLADEQALKRLEGAELVEPEFVDDWVQGDEKELISKRAVFANAAYKVDRPKELLGFSYDGANSDKRMATYYNKNTNRLVIAFRGTVPPNIIDVLSDTLVFFGIHGTLSLRMNDSLEDTLRIIEQYPADTRITLTGHSLGGQVAEHISNNLPAELKGRTRGWGFSTGKGKGEESTNVKHALDAGVIAHSYKTGGIRNLPYLNQIVREGQQTGELEAYVDVLRNTVFEEGGLTAQELASFRTFNSEFDGISRDLYRQFIERGYTPQQMGIYIQDTTGQEFHQIIGRVTGITGEGLDVLRQQEEWFRQGLSSEQVRERLAQYIGNLPAERFDELRRTGWLPEGATQSINLTATARALLKNYVITQAKVILFDKMFGMVSDKFSDKYELSSNINVNDQRLFGGGQREFVTYRYDLDPLSIHTSLLFGGDTSHVKTLKYKDAMFETQLFDMDAHSLDNFLTDEHKKLFKEESWSEYLEHIKDELLEDPLKFVGKSTIDRGFFEGKSKAKKVKDWFKNLFS